MDIQPATNQPTKPISDDQELAKVLAGVSKDANPELKFDDEAEPQMPPMAPTPPMQPMPPAPSGAPSIPTIPPVPTTSPINPPTSPNDDIAPEPPTFTFDESMMPQMPNPSNNNLEGIRKDALLELRPLVDKLDLAPEEKFDIYLLLLRSTDDTALIAPAHEAAKNIADEAKRAEALLDIIKEIDFLSVPPTSNPLKPVI